MERYTDEAAAAALQWKLGSVRYVKRQMRQRGLLQAHGSMDLTALQTAKRIDDYQRVHSTSFADATQLVLADAAPTDRSLEETLELVKAGQLAETALLIPIAERLQRLEKRI